jgi:probable F420-dependent oxidoreductase
MTDLTMRPDDFARAVEARGLHSIYLPEHTHIPVSRLTPPPTGEPELLDVYKRMLDPFVARAAAAAVTDRIRLGTGIALPAEREPIVTAKAIATLDLLAAGRTVLGIGFGWNEDELADHGFTMAERRDATREHMLTMQALWTEEVAAFDGDHVHLSPSWSWPKPVNGHLPVLVGGGAGPKLFAHIAEYADGWIPIGGAGLSTAIPELQRVVAEAGRDPSTLEIVPFGSIPDPGKLEHFAPIGVTECVFRVPSAGADVVLPILDDWAELIG